MSGRHARYTHRHTRMPNIRPWRPRGNWTETIRWLEFVYLPSSSPRSHRASLCRFVCLHMHAWLCKGHPRSPEGLLKGFACIPDSAQVCMFAYVSSVLCVLNYNPPPACCANLRAQKAPPLPRGRFGARLRVVPPSGICSGARVESEWSRRSPPPVRQRFPKQKMCLCAARIPPSVSRPSPVLSFPALMFFEDGPSAILGYTSIVLIFLLEAGVEVLGRKSRPTCQ